MKKKIIFMMLILSMGIFAKPIKVTVYCDDGYQPYSYAENGEVKGIYTDIFKKVFERLEGYDVTIKAVPWKRGINNLKTGRGFALYPPYYRPKERPYIDCSTLVLQEELTVFLNKKVMYKSRNNWPKDYIGLTIGINSGFALLNEEEKKVGIKIEEAKNNKQNILKLAYGRIDGYVNDRISVLWKIKQMQEKFEMTTGLASNIVEGASMRIENGYLGYTNKDNGKFHYKKDFKEKVDKILEEMKSNGEIEKIVKKYTE